MKTTRVLARTKTFLRAILFLLAVLLGCGGANAVTFTNTCDQQIVVFWKYHSRRCIPWGADYDPRWSPDWGTATTGILAGHGGDIGLESGCRGPFDPRIIDAIIILGVSVGNDYYGDQFVIPFAQYGFDFEAVFNCTGLHHIRADEQDFPPRKDCQGMAVWAVSEPRLNLWLEDEPLSYQPSVGPRVSFRLNYKQRETVSGYDTNIFSFGKNWNCEWLGFVRPSWRSTEPDVRQGRFPGGGWRDFVGTNAAGGGYDYAPDYHTGAKLEGDDLQGYTLTYPDGGQDVFGFLMTTNRLLIAAFLTERQDPAGNKLTFSYDPCDAGHPTVRLKAITDSDGLTTTLTYLNNHPYSTNLVSQVVDPFGRRANLSYNDDGTLSSITDPEGLLSGFTYGADGWVQSMTTPYGTTTFEYTDSLRTNAPPNGRSVRVIEPDGSGHLYLCKEGAPGIPAQFSAGEVPDTAPFANTFDTNGVNLRNAFHWNGRQYAALSTTDISALTASDYAKARMRHFLYNPREAHDLMTADVLSFTLSLERQPARDGTTPGAITWYDYEGKTPGKSDFIGTKNAPLFAAKVLPDGTSRFERTERNNLLFPTRAISTYSTDAGIGLRTNTFFYAGNGIDLLAATNALGVRTISNVFNSAHQVLTNFNALGEMTTHTYNNRHQPTSVSRPNGLITTNIYCASGSDSNRLQAAIDYSVGDGGPVYLRTNSFTYAGAPLVRTHTDPRGLTVTNTWDNLQRLRRVDFPDGTSITNAFDKLDLVRVIDRMGFTNSFAFDAVRHPVAATDANGVVTRYGYCSCGALESQTNAFGTPQQQAIHHTLDLQGNVIQTQGPDGYTITCNYNELGQLTNTFDGLSSVTNWYNHQGLLALSEGAAGLLSATVFDPLDRATNVNSANGVTVTNTYDELNRLLTRGYPDGGVERFGYSPNVTAATSYTNQLPTNVVNYEYDPLGRKVREVHPGLSTNTFCYSPAGDLVALADGKNQTNTWRFDEYGRVTNKVDATGAEIFRYGYDSNGRLTNRWTPAKGATSYDHDPIGNLTGVHYPLSGSVSLAYDALNRLTNMVDPAGTTHFSYDVAGQVLTEDGPWTGDSVSYSYSHRLRTSLSLAQPNAPAWAQTYAYDAAKRLTNVTSSAGAFGYAYDSLHTALLARLSLPNGSFITNSYDSVARLLATTLRNSQNSILNSHEYAYNLAGQRTRDTRTDASFIDYTYDGSGQLLTARAKEPLGSIDRLHEQFAYAYDAAGNLNWRTNNALVQQFAVNSLNELSFLSRAPGSTLTVAGTTGSRATSVNVNGQAAVLYGDNTFAKDGFTLLDGTNSFTAVAEDSYGRHDTNTVTCYQPVTNGFSYDANGNLMSDGQRWFDYDDENQLVSVTVSNAWRSEFAYDGKMRRRICREFIWAAGSWNLQWELHYIYDGNLVIQERWYTPVGSTWLAQNTISYTRGADLSGTLEGSGGIGGLLARSDAQRLAGGDASGHACFHSDGNGSVSCLVNVKELTVASYRYDPYGRLLFKCGNLADANVYRFSSKESDLKSELCYFLRRVYDPHLQRWLNRDPVSESGGANLYTYCGNNPVSRCDPLGLCWWNWFDDLARWARKNNTLAKTYLDNALPPWLATTLETADDLGTGLLLLPYGVAHLGEATGTTGFVGDEPLFQPIADLGNGAGKFSADPTLENSAGMFQDLSTFLSIASVTAGMNPKPATAAKSADTIAEGLRVSPYRVTAPGETFIRYESANPAFTRITPSGGVTPGTFAAPASDGLIPVADRVPVYNLPSPQIPRPTATTLTPPPGTPIIGPRPVVGGTGNEVIFPMGY